MNFEDLSPLKNKNMINAAFGEEIEHIPIFIHRQAGRHLPEYNIAKKNKNFFECLRDPKLASELTIQPVDRYDMDAAIIFSDILVVLQAVGFNIEMMQNKGPVLINRLNFSNLDTISFDASNLDTKLDYVYEAIKLTRKSLNSRVPLIGFAGGPFTLMTYIIEGQGTKTLNETKKWLNMYPEKSKCLLSRISNLIVQHLCLQVQAGAQLLEIFETQVGVLGQADFYEFVYPQLKQIISKVKKILSVKCPKERVPVILFAKGANHSVKLLSESGCEVLAIDWMVSPAEARAAVGDNVTLMGNLEPCVLYSREDVVKEKITKMVKEFGRHRYIANLGHGMLKDISTNSVKLFVDTVHSFV